jgi:signal transduction histidine kinase
MSLRLKDTLPLWFAAALVVLVVNAGVAHRNIESLAETNRQVAHTHEVQDALEETMSLLIDAETGERGFVITGDQRYLRPYDLALENFWSSFQRVATLVADNDEQGRHLSELHSLSEQLLDKLAKTVDLRRRGDIEAARGMVATDRGRQLMEEIRAKVREMKAGEDALLRVRDQDAANSFRTATMTNLIGAVLGSCMVVVAYYQFLREVRARDAHAAHLERKVAERTEALTKTNSELVAEVAERQRAEDKANAFAAELERSNRELQQFASVASHDLQEPLRKIQAFGDRLKNKCAADLDDQGREYLERMHDSAGRMRTLINDLLTFSRVKTKARTYVEVDLRRVAEEVVGDLEGRLQQTDGRVVLGDLPTIVAEPMQMRQLFQNLIGNALKFHKPGEPPVVQVEGRIRADAPSAAGDGGLGATGPRAEISVSDNGIGFEEKYLDRIFEVFQRLHGRNEYEGTGMGLAICRRIVELHGGRITARSRPGEGSTFVVTLLVQAPTPEESP